MYMLYMGRELGGAWKAPLFSSLQSQLSAGWAKANTSAYSTSQGMWSMNSFTRFFLSFFLSLCFSPSVGPFTYSCFFNDLPPHKLSSFLWYLANISLLKIYETFLYSVFLPNSVLTECMCSGIWLAVVWCSCGKDSELQCDKIAVHILLCSLNI